MKKTSKNQQPLTSWVPQETKVESTSSIRTPQMLDTLKGVSSHLTVQQMAAHRHISVKAVYKQIAWLRKNGYISAQNELTSTGVAWVSGGLRTVDKTTRMHDLRFRVEIIKYRDHRFASRRRQYLEMENIPFKVHHRNNWEGLFFALDKWRVEVTPRSFLLLAPDVLTDDTHEELLGLFLDVRKLVVKLESRFPVVCLEKGERLNVTVEGTHAALINNGLAKKYNKEKRVFELRDAAGQVRLIIDNSLRLNELEAVSPVWAVDDESKVKRLLHEAVVQDISLAELRNELRQVKEVLKAQVEVQKLQTTAGVLAVKNVRDLRDFFGGER